MRKCLFGTTALIGAVALATAASAQTAGPKAPFTAILDGDVAASFGIISGEKNIAHNRDYGLASNGWLRFFFEGHADNGLTYGFFVRTLAMASSITANGFSNDREGTYLKSSWGTFEIGSGSSPGKSGYPFVNAPWFPQASPKYLGPDGGLEITYLKDAKAATIAGALNKFGSDYVGAGRPTHIYYASPTFNGFDIGLDFAADGTSRTEDVFQTSTGGAQISQSVATTSQYQNITEAKIGYKGTMGPVAFSTAFTYSYGQSKNIFSPTGSSQANTDLNNWHTGFRANYAGFELATDFTYGGKSLQPKNIGTVQSNFNGGVTTWGWATGLNYYAGPWSVGALYWYARGPGTYGAQTAASGLRNQGVWEQNFYEAGIAYTLAPGLKVSESFIYYDMYDTHVSAQTAAASSTGTNARNPNGQIYLTSLLFSW